MAKKTSKLYYLASPYSHPDKKVMQERYELINLIAVRLIERGYNLIEPIAMCHEKSKKYTLPTGYEYWKSRDRLLVSRCDGIMVAKMDGWKESVGVTDEIYYAKLLGMPVYYIDCQGTEYKVTKERTKRSKSC